MYVSDTNKSVQQIWAYSYDIDDGMPYDPKEFFDTKNVSGRPDGATVDSSGCYWIAAIEGWALHRITPSGRLDRTVVLPIEKPSKPVFGGKDLDTLFVTSISKNCANVKEQPLAGRTLAITGLGVSGLRDEYANC